jgi:hypothetical protein
MVVVLTSIFENNDACNREKIGELLNFYKSKELRLLLIYSYYDLFIF